MRPLRDMETIQIEITNACVLSCSNCTRLCGHHPNPFFMTLEEFDRAVDSLLTFPRMIGVMGGEPLIHPEFDEICRRLHAKIPPERCGLWTTFPNGFERHADVIVETFGNILLNDHTREDVFHGPILVTAREHMREVDIFYAAHHCSYQNCWSASITPRGAYFCEVAAALDTVLETEQAWDVEPGWWMRSPFHFASQIEAFCTNCGGAMRCKARQDTEEKDDISPAWKMRLEQYGSPKMQKGKYEIYRGTPFSNEAPINKFRGDFEYFRQVASKYGLDVVRQPTGYLRPIHAST